MIVVIHVAGDRFFERSGQDLYCAVPITMAQASLGAEITIPLLDDKRVIVKVPAGIVSIIILFFSCKPDP